jgi:predicted enzyme related to lactoylglutathione lyase
MPAVGRFLFITIDALDPVALADFWAEVLGTEVDTAMDDGRFVFLKGRDGSDGSDEGDRLPVVCFQRVTEPKRDKVRVHLDLSVTDLEQATEQVLALGGSWPDGTDRTLEGFSWRTLADPEGNEFDIALG